MQHLTPSRHAGRDPASRTGAVWLIPAFAGMTAWAGDENLMP